MIKFTSLHYVIYLSHREFSTYIASHRPSILRIFNLGLTGLAVVDCSATSDTIGVLQQVAGLGGCIVLANKKPLTSSLVM